MLSFGEVKLLPRGERGRNFCWPTAKRRNVKPWLSYLHEVWTSSWTLLEETHTQTCNSVLHMNAQKENTQECNKNWHCLNLEVMNYANLIIQQSFSSSQVLPYWFLFLVDFSCKCVFNSELHVTIFNQGLNPQAYWTCWIKQNNTLIQMPKIILKYY